MKRNAAVVLGNVGTVEDVSVLEQALDDPEPLAREHVVWARERPEVVPDAPLFRVPTFLPQSAR